MRPLSAWKRTVGTALAVLALLTSACGQASDPLPGGGARVLSPDAHLNTPMAGSESANAKADVVTVTGPGFTRALRVEVKAAGRETNSTQLTLMTSASVAKEDVLLASLWVRGQRVGLPGPGRIELMFERSSDPWEKSVSLPFSARPDGKEWRQLIVAFRAADSYASGQAMLSIRMGQQPQWLEVGGVSLLNYRKSRSIDELSAFVYTQAKLGDALASLDFTRPLQTMRGFGGNFCQPRYGSTAAMDAVGQAALDNLRVVHARIGAPLNFFAPAPGEYRNDAQARASFLAMKEMQSRKIPMVVSAWEGPAWLMGRKEETMGTVIPPARYGELAEVIGQYLLMAKREYGVEVPYFSFNEPDYGVNFKFTPQEMGAFIKVAVRRWRQLGMKTIFLVADTANGASLYDFAKPLLEDPTLAPYLGPISFHGWDSLGATEESYRRIAELGRRFNKEVWCLEAGHDAQLWRAPNPWPTWENALRTAMAYERTIRLSGSSLVSYWTYQDNYSLTSSDGKTLYPVFRVMQQMEEVFSPGAKVVTGTTSADELQVIGTVGPKKGQFSALVVNSTGAGKVTLSGLPPRANVRVFVSSAEGQRVPTGRPLNTGLTGKVTVDLPARSVVTLVSAG